MHVLNPNEKQYDTKKTMKNSCICMHFMNGQSFFKRMLFWSKGMPLDLNLFGYIPVNVPQ